MRAITSVLFLVSSVWTGSVLLFEEPSGIDAHETMVKIAFYGTPLLVTGFLGLVLGLLVSVDSASRRRVREWLRGSRSNASE